MKTNFQAISIALLFFTIGLVTCLAQNPIVQTIYTADPAPMVHNGTFYVYSGHDEDYAGGWFWMDDWRCYSSTDMANWTDLGSPLDLNTFSWAASDAWAAHCTYRNGKFYFYATVKAKSGGWAIAVGVANNPAGPFTDAIGGPLVTHPSNGYIDPTVFIDDNGQAYMYWGNPGNWMVRLNEDMISTSGSIVEMPQNAQTVGNMYAEAPWFYKRNGIYYLVFATDDTGEQSVAYSTSTGPTGPWTFRGKIMNPSGTSWTLHPGIADFKDNSYIVYHTGSLPNGGNAFHRSVCVEKFSYNPDGTIPMIPITSSGSPQIGQLNPYTRIEAECIAWEVGVETENCSEGGMNVSDISNGDYIKVKGVNFGTGATSFEARVASATSGGNIEIRLDSPTGTSVGTCSVAGTGGWQSWVTQSCSISNASGIHDLYFVFTGGSGSLFNFNWWQFYEGGSNNTEVIFYQDYNYGGSASQPMVAGNYTTSQLASLGIPNDWASSVKVPSGWTVTMYDNDNFSGTSWTVNADQSNFGNIDANDKMTSCIITSGTNYIKIQNRATGLYIDGMGRTSDGSNASQWSSSASNNQQWVIETSGSYVRFKNQATGLYLDGMGRTTNGSLTGQWGNSGSNNQQWTIEDLGSYKRIKNSASGLYIDGMSWSTNGSDLGQWSNSGSDAQQWTITSLKSAGKSSVELSTVNEGAGNIALFPNPFTTKINLRIDNPAQVTSIAVFDMLGKQVEIIGQGTVMNEQAVGSSLKTGMYILQICSPDKVQSFKILKQ